LYRALPFVSVTGRPPSEIDALLHKLAQTGELIFRGFQRGTSFISTPRLRDLEAIGDAAAGTP
jgi:hypothetical protein